MKKGFAILMVLCLLVMNCCALAAPEADFASLTDAYRPVLERYAEAIETVDDFDALYEMELCPLLLYYLDDDDRIDAEAIRYGFADLENNGGACLLIYAESEEAMELLDAYTLDENAEPLRLFVASERDMYSLIGSEAENELWVLNEGSNSAFQSFVYVYAVEDGFLTVVSGILFDYEADENNPCYMTADGDFDLSNDTPISEEDAYTFIDAAQSTLIGALENEATMADYMLNR